RWPENEVPIGHVTNGVHMSSWDSEESDALWADSCGKDRWHGTLETLEKDMRAVSDSRLWECRASARQSLVEYVRERISRQLEASGTSPEEVEDAKHIFDANALTLGFARRFATYKRPNLLLHDPERLLRILTDSQRPVQLIIAGKAHPADQAGQALIQGWTHFIRRTEARKHVVFLSDYDMLLTGQLVQGVDVWINTPRRPWEACGTSGMKVLVNGGINLSELDGWWAEAYTPEVGWALGDGKEHGDDPAWDAADAEALYTLLEREVIPEFYSREKNGIPTAWVARMRESMARLTPRFSANRTVREYTEQYYIPAAAAYQERAADKGAMGAKLVNWERGLEQNWLNLRFGELKVASDGEEHVFEVQVYLGGLDPNTVRVELYADAVNGGEPVRQEMMRGQQLAGENGYVYTAEVPAARSATDYTARVIPHRSGAAVPLEAAQILWQQ
ncbi:MAG: alpha-glucan family phosphorylase, partial [Syntrophales bacterium]